MAANPTSVYYTGDGSTTDRVVPCPYLSPSHIKVTVDGVATAFSFVNSGTVRISPAPATGKTIRVFRETPKTPIIEWEDGVVILGRDLNAANVQNVYISEEAYNYATSVAEEAKQFAINSIGGAVEDALQQSEARLAAVLDPIRDEAVTAAATATDKAAEVVEEADEAAASATSALAHKNAAEASLVAFNKVYYGELADDPTADPYGDAPVVGALYFNTSVSRMKIFTGSGWALAYNELEGGITVNDSEVLNTSTVTGPSVKAALDTLKASLDALASSSASALSTEANRLDGRINATWDLASGKQNALGFVPVNKAGDSISGQLNTKGLTYWKNVPLAEGGDLNYLMNAGFYDGANLVNAPAPGWWHIEVRTFSQTNPAEYGYAFVVQIAHPLTSVLGPAIATQRRTRTCVNGVWGAWVELPTAARVVDHINYYTPSAIAAQGAGGVGTYAFLQGSGASSGAGSLTSGANLKWAAMADARRNGGFVGYGTWRAMGHSAGDLTSVYLRVA